MKKRLILSTCIPLLAITLSGCGNIIKYEENLEKYIYTMQYHEKFNVLQLSDIHWNANTSTMVSKNYLDKLFNEVDTKIKNDQGSSAKIDLVELTGDQFMLSNGYHVRTFLSYFESKAIEYGFMYAAIWGNHDRHGIYNPNWLSEQFSKAKHCIYIENEDDLYGRSNFVINLTIDGTMNSATKWQLANLDSGASFSETAISPFRDYDYIRKDQTRWWKLEHALVGATVPAIAYYHIPQDDNLKAYEIRDTLTNKFFKLEGFGDNGNPKYESDFIKVGRANNLKAAFMGHAHNVDWTVDYDGVVLGLGVKTGPELYFAHIDVNDQTPEVQEGLSSVGINENFDLIGASLVTITDDNNFDLEHLYFNERTSSDFVRWVKW